MSRQTRAHGWMWGLGITALIAVLSLPLFLVQGSFAAYTAKIANSVDKAGTNAWFTCDAAAKGPGNAFLIYAMNPSLDLLGVPLTEPDRGPNNHPGTYSLTLLGGTNAARMATAPTACKRDTASYVRFNGATCLNPSMTAMTSPSVFTIETWFRTSTTTNGRMIGFSSAQGGPTENQYDRSLFINSSGGLSYGVWNGSGVSAISTPGSVANGVWHQAVATQNGAAGALYLDGVLVGTQNQTPQVYGNPATGFWKIGCGANAAWTTLPKQYYTGDLEYVAAYTTALSATQIQAQYLAAK